MTSFTDIYTDLHKDDIEKKSIDTSIAEGGTQTNDETEKPLTREDIEDITRKMVDEYYKEKYEGGDNS